MTQDFYPPKPQDKVVQIPPENQPTRKVQINITVDLLSIALFLIALLAFAGWFMEAADRRYVQQQLERIQLSRVVHGG